MNHGWLCTGEDMYTTPWFYNLYKIVCKAHFNFNKATKCISGTSLFIKHYKLHTHTLHHAHLHFNTLQCSYTHYSSPVPDVLHCNTDTQYISYILPSSSIPFSTPFLQHIHQIHIHHTLSCCLHTLHDIHMSQTMYSGTCMMYFMRNMWKRMMIYKEYVEERRGQTKLCTQCRALDV